MNKDKNTVVIAGPTAVGKSSAAIELSAFLNAQIVSADSYQCYKYMDIGTAKPTEEEQKKVKHYMIDVYYPNEKISVFDFAKDARENISKVTDKNNAIIVGGSGLYIDSIVFQNYNFKTQTVDFEYRAYLQNLASENGGDVLFKMLEEVDPEYALTTHKNNIKRIIRALEYYHSSKEKMSENKPDKKFVYENTSYFVLNMERDKLYSRINDRVDIMMQNGLLDEVSFLYSKYGDYAQNAFKAIGYAELISYIKGETNLSTAVELIKQHSRNYAKRQYTWFRRNKEACWIDVDDNDTGITVAKKILEKMNV